MSKTKYITEQVDVDVDQDEEDLEKELSSISDHNKPLEKPENFGNKWSDQDKQILISMLKDITNRDLDTNICNIANKLKRTEGGVKGEIKKIIMDKYLQGESAEDIANNLNILYRNVKSIIKIYLDKDADNEIINLSKENKLLKLKIENLELRKHLKNLI
jgi:hypothetical protein